LDPLYLFVINTNVYNPIGVTNLALGILGNLSKLLDLSSSGSLLRRGITEAAAEFEKLQQTPVSNQKEINNLRSPLATDLSILKPREKNIEADRGAELAAYPSDLSKFYMRLDFKKYQRPSPNLPGDIDTEYSVAFPLPTNLEDKHDIDYETFDAGIAGAVMNSFNGGQGVTLSTAIRPVADFVKRLPEGQNFLNIASQKLAAALNPNKSIVFNSVKFRSYSFSWNFAPNTEEESTALRKIIRRIKSYSLPTYAKISEGNESPKIDYNVFNYPYMVKIHLYPWAGATWSNYLDPEMFQTKHCVIDNISINYSPENNLSFFNSEKNSPTFVSLSLNLTEIELFTGEDFGREGELVDIQDLIAETENVQGNVQNLTTDTAPPSPPPPPTVPPPVGALDVPVVGTNLAN